MRRTLTTLVVVLVVVLAVMPGVAAAATRSGGTVVVESGETIDGDLEAFGGSVVVRGTVQGDLQAFGGSVVVEGNVEGDVEATGGTVQILGTVGGDVAASGGTVDVGDDAQIGGSFEAGAGSIAVGGTVLGDARLGAESIRLGEDARIDGNLVYEGELTRASGATVGGSVTQTDGLATGTDPGVSIPGAVVAVYGMFVTLLVGALLLLLFPETSATVAQRATTDPLRTGGIGLGTVIGIPIVLGVIAFTVVGIPLALAGSLAFGLLAWVGAIYGRYVLGTWLLSLADVENRWAALVAGVVTVAVLRLIPVVDGLVRLVVFVLGFGALVTVLADAYRERRGPRGRTPRPADIDESGAEPV